ncbi:hypothetical protein HK103_002293 [Boothiomyces macroporosus]|uniref:chitin synthase n=1 Tax=Boothiomyces macroporosus TaxID=261099 RepID=A0AAD5Y6T3_9FUNG|nr:hypothetical protein HK103_002293 [Boothiomyces macroporosus]
MLAAEQDSKANPWVIFSWIVTCCFPGACLSFCWKMHSPAVQQAWREKVALCFICAVLMVALGFFTFGLNNAICTPDKFSFSYSNIQQFAKRPAIFLNSDHYNIIHGVVYDFSGILDAHASLPYFKANPSKESQIAAAVKNDVSPFFPRSISDTCQKYLQNNYSLSCTTANFTSMVHCHDWNTVSSILNTIYIGPVFYTWDEIASYPNLLVYNNAVLDMTTYLKNGVAMFGPDYDKVIKTYLGKDATKYFALQSVDGPAIGDCLAQVFVVGRLEQNSAGCWASQGILLISLIIVLGLVLIKFFFAVYFQWFISHQLGKLATNEKGLKRRNAPNRKSELISGNFPITMNDVDGNLFVKETLLVPQGTITGQGSLARRSSQRKSRSTYGSSSEVHTLMLVTCYSEDETALKTTFDSLAATDYNEDKKLLLIIADGIIKGAGNDRSTPDIILSLLEIDPNWRDPVELSYRAVADGSKQLNMAKVYVAWYNYEDRSVPTILIVKVGGPDEIVKPGNRGKRDSQMILMRFLQNITFNERMCPLEYDMFQKMHYLMGVTPDAFEIVLMVDADTKVAPDSLARMVASMVRDPTVMGLCGETRIGNKTDSWVTRIQVFEYYLSHHLTKAFESLFGGVSCLPGCFCMYRIKVKKDDTWIPIICAPEIISTYSQTVVDTLHKKNLLLLGEDRFLTTLMLRAFPRRKLIFVPRAYCKTTVPDTFWVLVSQRRRWINSTIHNLLELILVNELCAFLGNPQILPLLLLGAILGLPAVLIMFTTKRVIYIYWLFVYLLALPIWNFVLPSYAFWHFDDFSWGDTRKVEGEKKGGHGDGDSVLVTQEQIPLRKWEDWERDRRANMFTHLGQQMASLFLETLRQAELGNRIINADAYYSSLTAYGVRSVESLMQLTMQDYGVVGVNSMEDRKTDYGGDGTKKSAAMPIKSRFQMPRIGAGTMGSSQMSLGSNSGVPTRESSHSLDDINRSSLYDRTNRSSIMDTDDDQEDSPQQFRRPVKKGLGIASSPKQTRSNLNAYGVPITHTATTQKSQTASKNDLSDRIRVCVRKRPLSKKEAKRGDSDIAKVTGRRTITILEPKVKVDLTKYVENHEFVFDEAFDQDATNEEVYKRTALPLVDGQTGSGKTFTMLAPQNGLYVLAGRDIFSMLKQPQFSHLSAWVSFYEIYQGHLYDLLGSRKKLFAREDGKQQVIIKGIQEYEVDNVDRLMQIFESGNSTRSTGATGANSDSSRSHAIFQLVLKNKKNKKIHSKLSFIDLAGSERGADRGETDKQTR